MQCLILQGNRTAFPCWPLLALIFWTKVHAINNLHRMWHFETVRKGNEGGEESKNKTLSLVFIVNTNREYSLHMHGVGFLLFFTFFYY